MALSPERYAEIEAYLKSQEPIGPAPKAPPSWATSALKKGGATAAMATGGALKFAGNQETGQKVVDWAKQKQTQFEQERPSLQVGDIDSIGKGAQYIGENVVQTLPLTAVPIAAALGARALPAVAGLGKVGKALSSGAAAFAPSLATETGIISAETDQVEGNRGQILKGAVPAAALESLSDVVGVGATGLGNVAAKLAGRGVTEVAKKTLGRTALDVGKGLAATTVTEAATESAQSPLEAYGAGKPVFKEGKAYNDNVIKNTVGALTGGMISGENYTPEMKAEMQSSFFAGGAAGLGLGGAGKAVSGTVNALTKPTIQNDKISTDVFADETPTEVKHDSQTGQGVSSEIRKGKKSKQKGAVQTASPEEIEADRVVQEQREAGLREAVDFGLSTPEVILDSRNPLVSRKDVPNSEAIKEYVKKHPDITFDGAGNIIVLPNARAKFKKTMEAQQQKEAKQAEAKAPKPAKAPKESSVEDLAAMDALVQTKEHTDMKTLNKVVSHLINTDPKFVQYREQMAQQGLDPIARQALWQKAKEAIITEKGYKVVEKPVKEQAEPKQGKGTKAAKPNQVEGAALNLWAKQNAPDLHKAWNAKGASNETKKTIRAALEEAYKVANGQSTAKVETPPKRTAGTTKEGFKKAEKNKRTTEENKALDAWLKTKPEILAPITAARNTPDYKTLRDEAWTTMQGKGINTPKVVPTASEVKKGLKKDKKPKKVIDVDKATTQKQALQAIIAQAHEVPYKRYVEQVEEVVGKLSNPMRVKTLEIWKKHVEQEINANNPKVHKENLTLAGAKSGKKDASKMGQAYINPKDIGIELKDRPINPEDKKERLKSEPVKVGNQSLIDEAISLRMPKAVAEKASKAELEEFVKKNLVYKEPAPVAPKREETSKARKSQSIEDIEDTITDLEEDIKLLNKELSAATDAVKKDVIKERIQEKLRDLNIEKSRLTAQKTNITPDRKELKLRDAGIKFSYFGHLDRGNLIHVLEEGLTPSTEYTELGMHLTTTERQTKAVEAEKKKKGKLTKRNKIYLNPEATVVNVSQDVSDWTSTEALNVLLKDGTITKEEYNKIEPLDVMSREREQSLQSLLVTKGIDVLSYVNEVESKGDLSFIVLNRNSFKVDKPYILEALFGGGSHTAEKVYMDFLSSDRKVDATPSIKSEIKGFVEQLQKDFGLYSKIFITTDKDVAKSNLKNMNMAFDIIDQETGDYVGLVIPDGEGNHIISLSTLAIKNSDHLVETLTHEIGHIVIADHLSNASPAIVAQIDADVNKWIKGINFGTKSALNEVYHASGVSIEKFKSDFTAYLTDGKVVTQAQRQRIRQEYLAQQVSKYIIERQSKPEGLLSQFFKKVAESLRALFSTFQAYQIKQHRAIPSIEKWLDGLVESNRVERRVQEQSPMGNGNVPYAEYALPGPRKQPFNLLINASEFYEDTINDRPSIPSTHFGQGNMIHIRGDIRTTTDKKQVLHINEMQSDWDKQHVKSVKDKMSKENLALAMAAVTDLSAQLRDGLFNIQFDNAKAKQILTETNALVKQDVFNTEFADDTYTAIHSHFGTAPEELVPVGENRWIDNLQHFRNLLNQDHPLGARVAQKLNNAQLFKLARLKEEWVELNNAYTKVNELRTKLIETQQVVAGQTKNIAPPPIEGKYWMQHAIRQIIRYAKEKGIETVTFPSTPQQVADVENWGPIEVKEGRYFAHGQDMTSIIDRMINKVPEYLKALGNPVITVEVSDGTPLGWNAPRGQKPTESTHTLNAFTPSKAINDEAERFGPKFTKIAAEAEYSDLIDEPGMRASLVRLGVLKAPQSLQQTIQLQIKKLKTGVRQKYIDYLDSIKKINPDAYNLLRLSANGEGHTEAAILTGNIYLENGVYNSKLGGGKSFIKTLQTLKGEHNRWLWWIAAQRAADLTVLEKEALFSGQDIKNVLKFNEGNFEDGTSRAKVYADAFKDYQKLHNNILDVVKQSGMISQEQYEIWSKHAYIPFYRELIDGQQGPNLKKGGMVNLAAIKKIHGSEKALYSDLMHNVVSNWMHLLTTASKNRGAKLAIETAIEQKIAHRTPPSTKGAVYYYQDGTRKHVMIQDELVMESLIALTANVVTGPAMKTLQTFKHYLTMGVTMSPFYKVRNFLRDWITAPAISKIDGNIKKNFVDGWKIMKEGENNQDYLSLLASGGIIRFGTLLEGRTSKHIQALVDAGVDSKTILTSKVLLKNAFDIYYHKYMRLSDISEGINRAALYKQLKEKVNPKTGKKYTHAEATFEARDMLDFAMHGSGSGPLAGIFQFLAKTSPFLNTRFVGLDKLVRSFKGDKQKFMSVLGGVTLASIILAAMYHDDEDWKKREAYDKNNFWWFKFGDTAFRIPKPFEIGAIASLTERTFELGFGDVDGAEFAKSVIQNFSSSFAIDPVPQMFRPVLDVYANKNKLTGLPIVKPGMEGLERSQQADINTTIFSKIFGELTNLPLVGDMMPAPIQADYLVAGYTGWLGKTLATLGDSVWRGANVITGDQPIERPATDALKVLTGDLISSTPSNTSKYLSKFYDSVKELEAIDKTYRKYLKEGNNDLAQEYRKKHSQDLVKYSKASQLKKQLTDYNTQIRIIENKPKLSPFTKKLQIDAIRAREHNLVKNYK